MDLLSSTKAQICDFEAKLRNQLENTQTLFDNFVTRVNSVSNLNNVASSMDDLYGEILPDYREFCKALKLEEIPTDTYWYDMNKKEWLAKPITQMAKRHIIGNYTCDINLFSGSAGFNKYNNNNCSLIDNNLTTNDGGYPHYCKSNTNMWNNMIPEYYCAKKSSKTLKITIDAYYNIYLPEYKLYLVNNYQPIPNFAIYHNIYKIALKTTLSLNELCPSDKKIWDNIDKFTTSATSTFTTSQDTRNKFADGVLFQCINEHLNYDANMPYINAYISFGTRISLSQNGENSVIRAKSIEMCTQTDPEEPKEMLPIEVLELNIAECRELLTRKEREIRALVEDNKSLIKRLEDAKMNILTDTNTISAMQIKIIEMQEEINLIKMENIKKDRINLANDTKLRQMDELLHDINKLNASNRVLEETNMNVLIEKKSLQSKVIELGKQISNNTEEIRKANCTNSQIETEKLKLDRSNNELQEQIITLNANISLLEAKIAKLLEPETLKTLGTDVCNDSTSSEYSKLVYDELRNKENDVKELTAKVDKLTEENKKIKYQYEQVKLKMMNLFTN